MANDVIDQMLSELKDMSELQTYASAQYKQITELNKKLRKLEDENKSLQKMLENQTPVLKQEGGQLVNLGLQVTDQEIICVTQLRLLKEVSLDREMTLEETKRLATYHDILSDLRQNVKPEIEIQSSQLSDKELLQLVDGHKEA